MQPIKQSTPQPLPFTAVSSSNPSTRLDASTLTFTVRVIKSSGSSVAGGGTGGIGSSGVTQPDVTNAQGCCFYTPSAGDVNTLGPGIVRISASGMETREIPFNVVAFDPYDVVRMGLTALPPLAVLIGTVTSGTLTTTAFSTNLTVPASQLANAAYCCFIGNVTSALANQDQKVTGYSSGILSFSTGFSTAPAVGDQFIVINR